MDLTGGMQVRVPGNIHKFHRPRHEKILDGYEDFFVWIMSYMQDKEMDTVLCVYNPDINKKYTS